MTNDRRGKSAGIALHKTLHTRAVDQVPIMRIAAFFAGRAVARER